ncbi:MAG: SpoVA/SpoVAEb family sporulation membrane protein [Oscillospiraceae bacterium]|jgi:stage V sporulation protein AC|nr:SpoVA/SpoVAEb family sporulation membrane protein [Oscillospiraceae bacterium]
MQKKFNAQQKSEAQKKMSNTEYNNYVSRRAPKSPIVRNTILAFIIGGLICCVGQTFMLLLKKGGVRTESIPAAVSVIMVFLGGFATALHIYDRLAKHAGAGTLIPITGFANAIVSPAMEFKSEGMVTGMAAKMFVVAGPVIVFGVSASVLFGIIYFFLGGGK